MARSGTRTTAFGFIDVLLGVNVMVTILATLVLSMINPASEQDNQSPPGNMMVAIAWPDGPNDVDLWVKGPGMPMAVGYSNKGSNVFNLLRDDLGTAGDSTPVNFENAFSRGLPAGEYIINVHCYSCQAPVPVSVEVRIAGGVLVGQEVVTVAPSQELTVIRFKLDGAGRIIEGSQSKVYAPLRSAPKSERGPNT